MAWPALDDPPDVGGGDRDAVLIIGVEDYFVVPPVPGARQNARDWAAWFTEGRGTPSERVVLLEDADATVESIDLQARQLAESLPTDGSLWVVFVGHGAPDPDGAGVRLLGVDAQANAISLASRAIATEDLVAATEAVGDRRVFVLDACFSGRAPDGSLLVPGLQPVIPSWAIAPSSGTWLAASSADQVAGPLPGAARPAFSYLVLGALQGWGDRDDDGQVTASEAVAYAGDTLRATVLDRVQRPRLDGTDRVLAAAGDRAAPDLGPLRIAKPVLPTPPASSPARVPNTEAKFELAYWQAVAASEDPWAPSGDVESAWCGLARLEPETNPYRDQAAEACESWQTYRADREALWSGFQSEYDLARELMRVDGAPASQKALALTRLEEGYGDVDPWLGSRIARARESAEQGRAASLPPFRERAEWADRVRHQAFRWGWDRVLGRNPLAAFRIGGGLTSDGVGVVDVQPGMALTARVLDLSVLNVASAPDERITFGFSAGFVPFVVRPSRRVPGEARGSVVNPIVGLGYRTSLGDPDRPDEQAVGFPELYVANHLFVTNGFGLRLEARRPFGAGWSLPAVGLASLFVGYGPTAGGR